MSGYCYIKTEPALWTVGFNDPEGMWHTDSDHSTPEEAAQRVHWLNGGHAMDHSIDMAADAHTQVEIQHELGIPGSYKLYVHQGGRTVVRVCKLSQAQIRNESGVDFLAGQY